MTPDPIPPLDADLPDPLPSEADLVDAEGYADVNELEPVETSSPPPTIACRRCGKLIELAALCPHCRARLQPRSAEESAGQAKAQAREPIVQICMVFSGMVAVTLVYGLIHRSLEHSPGPQNREQYVRELTGISIAETIDLLLVAFALIWIGKVPRLKKHSFGVRLACWGAAVPVLVGLLGLNLGYHWFVATSLGLEFSEHSYPLTLNDGLTAWAVLVTCVQPAFLEEFFFRRLALGSLTSVSGIHAAVLVSSVMFGVAHIGVLLSIPLFVVIGIVLGYVRVLSGGITLPILLHFGHNAAIIYLQHLQ